MKPVKRYEVTVDYGDAVDKTTIYSARTPGGARYLAFLNFSDVCPDLSFRDFLSTVLSVRLASSAPMSYDYVREHYRVDVKAGQRVMAAGKPGIVAEPDARRTSMVEVYLDGVNASGYFHPSEIET